MSDLIDDSAVDGLTIVWDESKNYTGPRVTNAPPALRVIKSFLSRETWQHVVQFIGSGVVAHHGRVSNDSGFLFQSDLEADEDPFEGVQMFDPIDTIHVSEGAFDRLMSRYFTVIIDAVTERQRPELREPWWPSFVDAARAVRERVG